MARQTEAPQFRADGHGEFGVSLSGSVHRIHSNPPDRADPRLFRR
jgi:hypothetical protein